MKSGVKAMHLIEILAEDAAERNRRNGSIFAPTPETPPRRRGGDAEQHPHPRRANVVETFGEGVGEG
jgi:hypothetical protein